LQIASLDFPDGAFSSFGSTVTVSIEQVPDSQIRESSNPNWPNGDSIGYIFSSPIDVELSGGMPSQLLSSFVLIFFLKALS
jgi:hypothetical protein